MQRAPSVLIAAPGHKQKTKLNQSRDEVHNIGIGNDLSRVLPIELVQLRHPILKAEFKRKFVEGKLMQYELKGTEKQGKGPEAVASQEYQKVDVVFITDGQSQISQKFLVEYLDLKKKKGFRIFGVPIQVSPYFDSERV